MPNAFFQKLKTVTNKKPGRPATDGATDVVRVNIALTPDHKAKLLQLAGPAGASVWIRRAIDRAYNRKQK